jgi:hypothetical protein
MKLDSPDGDSWFLRWISSGRYVAPLVLVGLLLASPSLFNGLQADDYVVRAAVLDSQPWDLQSEGLQDAYRFLDGDPAHARAAIERGLFPWWSDPSCRFHFWRPITVWTHVLDFYFWKDEPVLMHLHSLLWFGVLVAVAAIFYRQLIGLRPPVWTAALAALLFTVEDSHARSLGWLADRATILGAIFGILALTAHDRWRRDGWRPGLWLAPIALAVALLSKETAIAIAGYLLAYAVFLDRGPWRRRLMSVLPYLAVIVAWYPVYRLQGFGTANSGTYIEPGVEPLRFLIAALQRGPILFVGQWAFPDSFFSLTMSRSLLSIYWLLAVIFALLIGLLLKPLIAGSALARFFSAGMLLSLVTACGAFSDDRQLMFVGVGGMGLLAMWLAGLKSEAPWLPSSRSWRKLAGKFAWLFVVAHLVVAPLLLMLGTRAMKVFTNRVDRMVATLPVDLEDKTVISVASDSWLVDFWMLQSAHGQDEDLPAHFLSLAAASRYVSLTRHDATTLVVRPDVGYLPSIGLRTEPKPDVSMIHLLQTFDRLVRRVDQPMHLGETIELPVATVEITRMTDDNRPAEATFRFRVPLEDSSLCWVQMTGKGYRRFVPPAIGESVEVRGGPGLPISLKLFLDG